MPPPTLADVIFPEQASPNLSRVLGDLKRSNLSIPNRLRSIRQDARFVELVAAALGLPLVANERCGSWYIDPARKAASAYFKSTDGHTGQWKFSTRRLNLHLLELIGRHDGSVFPRFVYKYYFLFFIFFWKQQLPYLPTSIRGSSEHCCRRVGCSHGYLQLHHCRFNPSRKACVRPTDS